MDQQLDLFDAISTPESPVSFIQNDGADTEPLFFQGTRPLSNSELDRLFFAARSKPRNAALVLTYIMRGCELRRQHRSDWGGICRSVCRRKSPDICAFGARPRRESGKEW